MEPEVKDIIFDTNLKQVQQEMRNTAKVAKMMGESLKENNKVFLKDISLEDAEKNLKRLEKQAFNLDKAAHDVEGFEMSEESVKGFENALKKVNKEIELTKQYIEDLKSGTGDDVNFKLFETKYSNIIENIKKLSLENPGKTIKTQMEGFEIVAEKGKVAIIELGEKTGDLKDKAEDAGEKVEDVGKKVEVSFKGGIKQLTRFTLGLIGIRSVWTILTRAANTYMNENKEIQSQLKITYSIFANLIGPAVSAIVNVLEYATIILAKVIQTLTKYDVLAKVSANVSKDLAKQAGKAAKALASFDTITNLTQPGDNEAYKGMLDAFNDYQDKVDVIKKFWKDWGIWVTTAVTTLSALWSLKTLGGLAKLIGVAGTAGAVGTGLAGVMSLLTGIAAIGLIAVTIKVFVDYVQGKLEPTTESEQGTQSSINMQDNSVQKLKNDYINLAKKQNKTAEEEKRLKIVFNSLTNTLNTKSEQMKLTAARYNELVDAGLGWTDAAKEIRNTMNEQVQSMGVTISSLKDMADYTTLTKEEQEQLTKTMKEAQKQATYIVPLTSKFSDAKKEVNQMQRDIDYMTSRDYSIKFDIKTDITIDRTKVGQAIRDVLSGKTIQEEMRKYLISVGIMDKYDNSIIGPRMQSYDIGTNYVPSDQLAMIHKGEMIVPAKYNPSTSGIGGTNDETNKLLSTLINVVENKQFNGYISASDITNTAINGINQQSRIMGRSVIK